MSTATHAGDPARAPLSAVPDPFPDPVAFLAQADEVLLAFPDERTILRALATILVPAFADWCATYVLGARGPERVMLLHAAEELQPRLEAAFAADGIVARDAAWRMGLCVQPEAAGAWRDLLRSLDAGLGPCACVVVPVAARGVVAGCVVLGWIVGELYVVPWTHWLQPFEAGIGLLMIALGSLLTADPSRLRALGHSRHPAGMSQ